MSARADYLRWRHGPAVGCTFARLIAIRPADYGQIVEEIPTRGTPMQVAATIARRIDRYVSDEAVSAAALLMPDISTLKRLTEVALALRSHPEWLVSFSPVEDSRWGDLVAARIAREVPFGDAALPSEALFLGPFDDFPPTRRAPVLALEIYLGEPMTHDPKTHEPSTKANLAHMSLGPDIENATVDAMWNASKDARLKSLGLAPGLEDNRAKAKVSFVIPATLAQQLGCAP
jgi:hypothetical protein